MKIISDEEEKMLRKLVDYRVKGIPEEHTKVCVYRDDFVEATRILDNLQGAREIVVRGCRIDCPVCNHRTHCGLTKIHLNVGGDVHFDEGCELPVFIRRGENEN